MVFAAQATGELPMTDRVLTDDAVQLIITSRRSIPGDICDLIISHRLLRERVTELETTVGWYEAKHPND